MQDVAQAHEGDELEQLARRRCRSRDLAAGRVGGELEPREGVDRHRVRLDPLTSQTRRRRRLAESAQTRSQSPGRSARAIGPRMAKAIVCGAEAAIRDRPCRRPETHRCGDR